MTETDRRQRVITSTPHVSPEEVASRNFATSFRGYAETEVRAFLKRVAEELVNARERERELTTAVDDLEAQLRAPRPLSEQELLDALGEETARLLRSAREAGDDIRKKAEERAARMVDEAKQAADQMRAEASEVLEVRTREADERAAHIDAAAHADATTTREAAEREAESLVDAARQQGRQMLEEARAARERVLGDLVRRRALLAAQVEELRGGRDRLLDAYRVVKRTFLEATEALVQVEARVAQERAAGTGESIDIEAEVAAEVAALDALAGDGAGDGEGEEVTEVLVMTETDVDEDATVTEAEAVVEVAAVDDERGEGAEGGPTLADVDSLFARLRAGQEDATAAPAATAAATTTATSAADAPLDLTELAEPMPLDGVRAASSTGADEWRHRRSEAVDPLMSSAVKRAKRAAQDDQNALLDAVRRHKGRPTAEQVLTAEDAFLSRWADVLRPAIDSAYASGRVAAGGDAADAEQALAEEAARTVVAPLRERVTAAIDSNTEDAGGLVERIGARYREWKNQSLEHAIGDAVALAWSRGVYDATPDGAVLQWIPPSEGRCADCDDNGLEPTVKGEAFPTGQTHPPAHPGCRCLLAPM